MSDYKRTTEDLSPLETALARLVPHAEGWNRDQILFLAGQASVSGGAENARRRTRWGWPSAFGAMTAVAATLLVMLLAQQRPQMATVENQRPAEDVKRADTASADVPPKAIEVDKNSGQKGDVAEPAVSPAVAWRLRNALRAQRDGAAYLYLRDRVLAFGLDEWTSTTDVNAQKEPASVPSYQQLRMSWMGS